MFENWGDTLISTINLWNAQKLQEHAWLSLWDKWWKMTENDTIDDWKWDRWLKQNSKNRKIVNMTLNDRKWQKMTKCHHERKWKKMTKNDIKGTQDTF